MNKFRKWALKNQGVVEPEHNFDPLEVLYKVRDHAPELVDQACEGIAEEITNAAEKVLDGLIEKENKPRLVKAKNERWFQDQFPGVQVRSREGDDDEFSVQGMPCFDGDYLIVCGTRVIDIVCPEAGQIIDGWIEDAR